MKKSLIVLFLLLIFTSIVFAQQTSGIVYALIIQSENSVLTEKNLSLIEGDAPTRVNQPTDGYELKVVSFDGQTLHSFKFLFDATLLAEPPPDIFDENSNQIIVPKSTPNPEEKATLSLIIPYFENGKTIDIYGPLGQIALSVDISKYSKKSIGGLQSSYWAVLLIGLGIAAISVGIIYRKKINSFLENRKLKGGSQP